MQHHVPEGARRIVDIALSGNGEPTSAREFPEIIDLLARLRGEFGLDIPLRLITNGSLVDRPGVQEGLRRLAKSGGEIWFKLDAGTREGTARINNVHIETASLVRRLTICSERCNTWVQTCCFTFDGKPPAEDEITAWLDILQSVASWQKRNPPLPDSSPPAPKLLGVHLYGLARPSLQKEATRLGPVSSEWMTSLGDRVKKTGLTVQISP